MVQVIRLLWLLQSFTREIRVFVHYRSVSIGVLKQRVSRVEVRQYQTPRVWLKQFLVEGYSRRHFCPDKVVLGRVALGPARLYQRGVYNAKVQLVVQY